MDNVVAATGNTVADSLSAQLDDYHIWREGLMTALSDYQDFLERHGQSRGIADLPTYEIIQSLKSDNFTIAIVGEFSRGKTELINSIFFADHKERLLPTDAGRTTMCPTELLHTAKLPPCIMLLPIETREGNHTIAEYKRSPTQWTRIPLPMNEPTKMAETLKEIIRNKKVSIQEAQRLDLYNPDDTNTQAARDGMVEIPVWRHAIVNYPHPLLQKGLVVLDTPGLNSLGSEPELTLNMLPNAHAVLFVLSADQGVTKSDLEIWNSYVKPATDGNETRRIVVLNKVDTLWDELRGDAVVEATISRQMQETAQSLGITKSQVFPVSALKGLISKIRGDEKLLNLSGLRELEHKLTREIIPYKQALIHDKIVHQVGDMVENTESMVQNRLKSINTQLEELKGLRGQNQATIQEMIESARHEQQAYEKKVENFNKAQIKLKEQMRILAQPLSLKAFDRLISQTRKDMHESWTTHGLKIGMKTFFDGTIETMQEVNKQAHAIKEVVEGIYSSFQVEHGLAKLKSQNFSLRPYLNELSRLYREAEAFRNSPVMVMMEQHFVIKRFFISMVSHARNTFSQCNEDVKVWYKSIMNPVMAQIQEHKEMINQRTQNLRQISVQQGSLDERIAELESTREDLESQQKTTAYIRSKINQHVFLNKPSQAVEEPELRISDLNT
ncbi:MAG: dynamin family protein [Proteobacteria bacterium]|nr:dynamin family protein [Pseudomonadota bacterium]